MPRYIVRFGIPWMDMKEHERTKFSPGEYNAQEVVMPTARSAAELAVKIHRVFHINHPEVTEQRIEHLMVRRDKPRAGIEGNGMWVEVSYEKE